MFGGFGKLSYFCDSDLERAQCKEELERKQALILKYAQLASGYLIYY